MALHAFIQNKTVVKVEDLSPEQWAEEIQKYSAILDVDGLSPQPKVGWQLTPEGFVDSQGVASSLLLKRQFEQRVFGERLAKMLVDLMGAKNLELSSQGQTPNIPELLQSLGLVKGFLETGALATAKNAMLELRPADSPYSHIFDEGISEVENFLQQHNYL